MLSLLLFLAAALPAEAPKLRLPDGVKPLSYALDLTLTPGQDDFSGRVTIEVQTKRETPVLWLHAKELEIRRAEAGGATARAELVPAGDFLALTPERPLSPGRHTVMLEYAGKMSRSLTDGLFHQHDNGEWYAFTKFEPVTARRAFPCFDEPSFKTPWQLTLHVPAALKAFSNTPVESETPEAGGATKTVRFLKTRPLPSYLVVLAVGPFDTVDVAPMGRNRVPGKIIVPKGRAAEAAWAAAETPKAVAELERYLGTPYPFEKLDQIVVPLTTAWGAMENAGMVAYGQFLLAKPEEDNQNRQRSRLSTMVHEISHQWLGDLVTTAWWDEIWLNEGFAVWITPKILERLHPEWKLHNSAGGTANSAMSADALVSARKVRQPIEAPGDIANAFDGISYMKGAALLRMFENWIGEERFQRGVRSYLKRYAWSNATTPDLMAELSKAAGRDVGPAFASFLDRTGVPLLRASIACEARPVLRLAQERYVPIGSKAGAQEAWQVPVCFRWSDGKQEQRQCVLLTAASGEFALAGAKACPQWFALNDDAAGYYRAAYQGEWFDRLLEHGLDRLPTQEQAALLQSVVALVTGAKLEARQALALAQRFTGSNEREIFNSALRAANSVLGSVGDEDNPRAAHFLRTWLGPRARELGWLPRPADSEDIKAIRNSVVPLVAIGGEDPELGAEARKLAEQWLENRQSVSRETAPYALITAARHGDRAFFDRLLAELKETKDQRERGDLIASLGAFRDPELMRAALELVLHPPEGLDARELRSVITTQWRETRAVVWEYVQKNFDELNAKLPGARGIPYGATLPGAVGGFCDEASAARIEAFFKPRISGLSGGARNLAGALERIRLCAARRQALGPSAREFLEKY